MTDTQEPSKTQKDKWTVEALEIIGFEEMPAPGIYAKKHNDRKILVDMHERPPVAIFMIAGKRVAEDDEHGTLLIINQIIVDAETGKMPTQTEPTEVVNVPKKGDTPPPESNEPEVFDPPEPVQDATDTENALAVPEPAQACAPQAIPELSIEIIKKYVNDKATDEEAYVFLELCKARGLNPFLKEAYLIKYDHVQPATMVVGKDAFMKRAEVHPEYDGFEAGIIVETEGKEGFVIADNCRVGTFLKKGETLLGGWAKIYRKDHKHPVEITVSMNEFNTGKSSWKKMPATMIRKVALVNALRESFPSELSGMYDQSEMGVDVST